MRKTALLKALQIPLYFILGLFVFSLIDGFEVVQHNFKTVLICIVILLFIGVILGLLECCTKKDHGRGPF